MLPNVDKLTNIGGSLDLKSKLGGVSQMPDIAGVDLKAAASGVRG